VDGLGNPIHVHLTGGNAHDVSQALELIQHAKGHNFIGDKAYRSKDVFAALKSKEITPVIPLKSNTLDRTDIDRHLYKERHLVELFFNKLKQYRRIATRYEKLATNFLGFVLFASVRIWLA
jgi:transposase